ncbi:MAG: hypothetical protein HOQ05_11360 [Corynebacteriales bacterium]|nr:hypothetical protein [Mycobacteriales bacterium]
MTAAEIDHASVAGAPVQVVRALAQFVVTHGGFATAVIERIGRYGARIVIIGEDGVWGDQVVDTMEVARAACIAAKIEIADGWSQSLMLEMPYQR